MRALVRKDEAKFLVNMDSGKILLVDGQTELARTGRPALGDGVREQQLAQARAAQPRVRTTAETRDIVTLIPAAKHGVADNVPAVVCDKVAVQRCSLPRT